MKKIDDEVSLKKELDSLGIRYGSTMNKYRFFVEFIDNKAWTTIYHGVYASPIVAIRQLNDVIQRTKLPDKDIDIVLRFAFETQDEDMQFYTLNYILNPYIYYEKKEVKIGDDSENVEKTDSE